MAEYTITLPDGTCVEGDDHINVVRMAQILRETKDATPTVEKDFTYTSEEYREDIEDSKTLQERVDEAFANGRVGFETEHEADDEDVREVYESFEHEDTRR